MTSQFKFPDIRGITLVSAILVCAVPSLGASPSSELNVSIGRVVSSEGEVRWTNLNSPTEMITSNQELTLDQAIRTGPESQAHLVLESGLVVHMGPESDVEVMQIKSESVLNFRRGTYKIHLPGPVRVAFNGELKTMFGEDSEVQLTVGDQGIP